ncbi:MDR/zinc-dependent alcohol dehydrogenase-like family protein [Streptomyces alfalfae]|uniref:Zinc-binding dehydrogenase n=1 Tax=Streptomyces alfalfae TaxID=1642299 RepID=A0A7T4PKT3_9ACTN|nr:medium chain dehydrogenase/reductase family protein [Streptomyces alfalfae]QQC92092.1 zinc-binding dehydrogenase [Streptomyces alfalfae]
MRVLVAGGGTSEPPADCAQVADIEVRGERVRFGVVERADTAFDPAADHNRAYVLIGVRSFSLGGSVPGRPESGRAPSRWVEFGTDFVAEVLAVGSAVTTLAPGDRVVPVLTWPPVRPDAVSALENPDRASRQVQRVHHAGLLRLPPGAGDAEAACLPTAGATAYAMVRRAAVARGDSVLVTAAGSTTSLAAVQAARLAGGEVYAVSHDGAAAPLLTKLGVTRSFSAAEPGDWAELTALAKSLRGFDVILDPAWRSHFRLAAKLLGFSGRYVAGHDPAAEDAAADWAPAAASLVAKNASFAGQRRGDREDLAAAVDDLVSGRLQMPVHTPFRGTDVGPFVLGGLDPHTTGGVTYAF